MFPKFPTPSPRLGIVILLHKKTCVGTDPSYQAGKQVESLTSCVAALCALLVWHLLLVTLDHTECQC